MALIEEIILAQRTIAREEFEEKLMQRECPLMKTRNPKLLTVSFLDEVLFCLASASTTSCSLISRITLSLLNNCLHSLNNLLCDFCCYLRLFNRLIEQQLQSTSSTVQSSHLFCRLGCFICSSSQCLCILCSILCFLDLFVCNILGCFQCQFCF